MKLLCVVPENPHLSYIAENVIAELRALSDFEIEILPIEIFYFKSTYFQRKLCKLGFKSAERKHNEILTAQLREKCRQFNPDCVLVLFGKNVPPPVQKVFAEYKTILWVWDSVQYPPELQSFVNFAGEIFCFEHSDLAYLSGKNLVAHYLPLGANDKIYFPLAQEQTIDISFVGMASKFRNAILDKVCTRATEKNWRMKIGGIFYDESRFWKKYLFAKKHPHIAKFLDNRYFSSAEVADLYRRSKICLNLNTKEHRSLSPRTFEICATKSFQLMNGGL